MTHDLIYGPKECETIILNKWPQAIIKDASDEIHEERFEVDIPDVEQKDFTRFIIKEGFGRLSFIVGVNLYKPQPWFRELLNELRVEQQKEKPTPNPI